MLKTTLIAAAGRRPAVANLLKRTFRSRLVAGNPAYRLWALRKARQFAGGFNGRCGGVAIETTLTCNAKCLMCAHTYGDMRGTMSMELFEKIVNDCLANGIRTVGLSVYGEPFMDKRLFERIELLRRHGLRYGFSTNGSLLDGVRARRLFELGGLERINFSVNGFSAATYERVMGKLDRDKTYANILEFLRMKRANSRDDLHVSISMVRLRENEHELSDFAAFWRAQPGVDAVIGADLWDRIGDRSPADIGQRIGANTENLWLGPCRGLWEGLSVYHDGRVAPCCFDNDKRELIVGNLRESTIADVFQGPAIRELRHLHLTDRRSMNPVCARCDRMSPWI